ncbi:hypothetical protein RYH80_09935 [Halobaculum sp. MBLA0147]|uniref:hypothetical protein n=1 Tax=Halobaculum sp. MBLA0147 TaxID=3079934 RepID=UPI003525CDD6
MSEWKIRLWQSRENFNNHGETPLKRAKTYIEGAFSNISGETASVTLGSQTVKAPQQACRPSFEAERPCFSDGTKKSYDSLLQWWHEWLSCNNARVADSNVLITNGDIPGGGYSEVKGDDGTVSSGAFLADLPSSYTKLHSKNDAFRAMAATLHEVGHNVMVNGGNHHQRGNTYNTSIGKVNTVMGPVDGGKNYCKDDHDGSQDNIAIRYSDCSKGIIEK